MAQNSKSSKNKQNKQQQPAGKKVIFYFFKIQFYLFLYKKNEKKNTKVKFTSL